MDLLDKLQYVVTSTLKKLKEWATGKLPSLGPIALTGAAAITIGNMVLRIAQGIGLILTSSSAAIIGLSCAVLLSTI